MSIFVFAVCAARGDALLVPRRPHALHGSRRATKSAATASLRMSAAQQELRPASLALEIPRQAADDVLAWASAGGRGAPPEDDAATFGYDGLEVRRTTSSMMTRQQTSLGRTSSKDWLHCLSTWPRSYVLERIKNPLAAIVGWSAVVAAWMAASPAAPRSRWARASTRSSAAR
ncbi:PAP fibrillin [Aureococcus anophagefferens]|nr:PAP fibrillin [Aureococcus anophagefferens]